MIAGGFKEKKKDRVNYKHFGKKLNDIRKVKIARN